MVIVSIYPLSSKDDFNRMCVNLCDVLTQHFPVMISSNRDKILCFCSLFEFEDVYKNRLEWFIDIRRALVVIERLESLNEIELRSFVSA